MYALILVAGFAARFIINAVQKNKPEDASSSVSSSSQVDDSSTPDVTAAETTEKAAAGDAEIVSITPDETYLAVLEDGTATIKVSLSAHGAANGSSLQWTSSDEKIATVDENGAVKGVAAGTCTISVSAERFRRCGRCRPASGGKRRMYLCRRDFDCQQDLFAAGILRPSRVDG